MIPNELFILGMVYHYEEEMEDKDMKEDKTDNNEMKKGTQRRMTQKMERCSNRHAVRKCVEDVAALCVMLQHSVAAVCWMQ